jgi:glycerate kinase
LGERSTVEMNVLYAPDSYGGFMSAPDATARFEEAAASAGLFVTGHPMSDGGEGLIDVLRAHGPVELHGFEVPGPSGDLVFATAARRKGVWWIESAEAIGLHLLSDTAMDASSFGLGLLMRQVAHTAPGPIMVGLGGTGTMDGGLGMLQALGFTLRDSSGRVLSTPATAQDLTRVAEIDGTAQIPGALIRVLCDVRTPLVDAPRLYGPQKGLSDDAVATCSRGLEQLCAIMGGDPTTTGGGAAGGIGFMLGAKLRAVLSPGAELMAKVTGFDGAISQADVVVTGEGRLDETSFGGKVVGEVHRQATTLGLPVHALVGEAAAQQASFTSIHDIGGLDVTAFDDAARRLCETISASL